MRDLTDPVVHWLRQFTPYVHQHRGATFIISCGGEALNDGSFTQLAQDIALLHGLGIKLVLVHGARPQIADCLSTHHIAMNYVNGVRITEAAALPCVKSAIGAVRIDIEAQLSLGLMNTTMAGIRLSVASGNFVIARPFGIINGVDYQHTGVVRRIDHTALNARLDAGAIALVSPLGYAPTGEIFNLTAADVARSIALGLGADKLIFLIDPPGLCAANHERISTLLFDQVESFIADTPALTEEIIQVLRAGATACHAGIKRVHFIDRTQNGALLKELFTRDGAGTLLSSEPFEALRPAQPDDVAGILALLAPLEQQGIVVQRSYEQLEHAIHQFHVAQCENTIIACAAFHPYYEERIGELAALAVHPDYRAQGRGARLLAQIETLARSQGLTRLFVLTTQTAHWFRERGFIPAPLSALPAAKKNQYNFQRNSQMYIKTL